MLAHTEYKTLNGDARLDDPPPTKLTNSSGITFKDFNEYIILLSYTEKDMSLQVSSIGTTNATYAHNKDRGGSWANYLQTLSQSNNHDRQIYNGELNAKVGIKSLSTDIPHEKIKVKRTKMAKKGLDPQEVAALKGRGYPNPRYDYHGDG
jgi:hypothetical protein